MFHGLFSFGGAFIINTQICYQTTTLDITPRETFKIYLTSAYQRLVKKCLVTKKTANKSQRF